MKINDIIKIRIDRAGIPKVLKDIVDYDISKIPIDISTKPYRIWLIDNGDGTMSQLGITLLKNMARIEPIRYCNTLELNISSFEEMSRKFGELRYFESTILFDNISFRPNQNFIVRFFDLLMYRYLNGLNTICVSQIDINNLNGYLGEELALHVMNKYQIPSGEFYAKCQT